LIDLHGGEENYNDFEATKKGDEKKRKQSLSIKGTRKKEVE